MDKTDIMKALEKRFTYHPNVWQEFPIDNEEWVELGSPHIWTIEDSYDKYTLLSDSGYGWLAIISSSEELEVSTSGVVMSTDMKVVAVSEIYDLPRPILFKRVRME